jgi:hypothetical protein
MTFSASFSAAASAAIWTSWLALSDAVTMLSCSSLRGSYR